MDKIKLHRNSSVVELGATRRIIYQLCYSAMRDGDYLKVFDRTPQGSLYITKADQKGTPQVCSLYIDEGGYSDCMLEDGVLARWNDPWDELVDYCNILSMIYTKFYPNFNHPTSGAMGRGRNTRDRISGYQELMKDCEFIEWVTTEKVFP